MNNSGNTVRTFLAWFVAMLFIIGGTVFNAACSQQPKEAEKQKLNEAQLALLLQFERRALQVQQSIKSGILTKDPAFMVQAAQTSLSVFDTLAEIEASFPEARELTRSYQDFYAKLVTIISLFFENRLERGRATLMELEESNVFIYGKLRNIMSTATGQGCVPCFSQ